MRRSSVKLGLYRHRGTINSKVRSLDTFRDPISTETNSLVSVFWCREIPREGFEFQKYGGVEAQMMTVFEGLYVSGIIPSMVLVVSEVEYDIMSVVEPNDRITIKLVCKRRF